MDKQLLYDEIPQLPEKTNAATVISRMVDGLGFRYHWATEGLTANEIEFRPVDSSRNMIELIGHIYDLAFTAHKVLTNSTSPKKELSNLEDYRQETLTLYWNLSQHLRGMDPKTLENYNYNGSTQSFPFWYLINGQIADALTHVGQVVSWRRIAGNPQPKGVNVFLGKKN
ncbi:hypothetical protein [Flammeovirga sp. SJP92]|uniref:hypothetical protein n=1 Tax=Flammeovirga sp. SJP92 TaxID=1775430 RepID=UPI0007873BF2|nr:hypothetical protein [Flammeovirga sp. SJP92]KXX71250.1 hypothetical protein AVL50_09340 [Flammeovirga sp. SJP92]